MATKSQKEIKPFKKQLLNLDSNDEKIFYYRFLMFRFRQARTARDDTIQPKLAIVLFLTRVVPR